MIRKIQRGIILGLMSETSNPDDVNKRFEIFEKLIPKYKHLFTKEQLQILRIIYHDAKRYNVEGTIEFNLSEISEKMIIKRFPYLKDELDEILTNASPVTEKAMAGWLKILENQMLEI